MLRLFEKSLAEPEAPPDPRAIRRMVQRELAEAVHAKLTLSREFEIRTDRFERIISAKIRPENRVWLDRVWLRACQHVGRCLAKFSESLRLEAEAKAAKCA